MSNKGFQKFIENAKSGAKKKEQIRQEKKHDRQLKNEYFEKKKVLRSQESGVGSRESGVGSRESRVKSRESGVRSPESGFRSGSKKVSFENKKSQERKSNHRSQTSNFPQGPVGKPPAASASGGLPQAQQTSNSPVMPVNKYIAHAGICSRRDAAELVKAGKVSVNGQEVREPGFKVTEKDEVKVNGKKISVRKHLVYILLNKPKDFITTVEDPQGRKTVLDIVKNATPERVYPVGRLDRNTTGVLLLTNDGELAQKLSHPSFQVKKIYEVKLDRPLQKKDFETIIKGVYLDDGFVAPDALAYADSKDKSVIGIEIHSGRNRIVRRLFEKLGYDVRNLDRVMYGNLTKKNVERGKWRFLSEKEVRLLKFMNRSFVKKQSSNPASISFQPD